MLTLTLFQGVSAEKLKALAEHAPYRTCKAGEMFIGETDPARALQEIHQRIASLLIHALRGKEGQRELAKILRSTPESLSRALRKMSNTGVLAVDDRSIRILDREALGKLAEGD